MSCRVLCLSSERKRWRRRPENRSWKALSCGPAASWGGGGGGGGETPWLLVPTPSTVLDRPHVPRPPPCLKFSAKVVHTVGQRSRTLRQVIKAISNYLLVPGRHHGNFVVKNLPCKLHQCAQEEPSILHRARRAKPMAVTCGVMWLQWCEGRGGEGRGGGGGEGRWHTGLQGRCSRADV